MNKTVFIREATLKLNLKLLVSYFIERIEKLAKKKKEHRFNGFLWGMWDAVIN